ncbi:MAG: phosphoglycerate mutase family protein [Oligoflexia bacterium]|nr:phosphoglycerate mutase family protein [Oligoflexia bacterium]
MVKTIVVLRHAHRDTTLRSTDNGLSPKGREQVQKLIQTYKKGELPKGVQFWSSPKIRCQETIEPLCQSHDIKLKIEPLLNEQTDTESSKEFNKRIDVLAQKVKSVDDTLYVCSHGDVIPELIQNLTGYSVDLRKAQAAVLLKKGDRWMLA